jgi:hypothetical protein
MSFGRLDATCARCIELASGAPRRDAGWSNYKWRKQQDAQRLRDIREHNCKTAGCGPVCTAFEY